MAPGSGKRRRMADQAGELAQPPTKLQEEQQQPSRQEDGQQEQGAADSRGSQAEEETDEASAEAADSQAAQAATLPTEVYEVLCRLLITDKHIRTRIR
jgi:hypothetical protein